jgi:hypothetical protein
MVAAASLAAIWFEHQADTIFKLIENSFLSQGHDLSDDRGINVADVAHDGAALPATVGNVESQARMAELSNDLVQAPQSADKHEIAAPNVPADPTAKTISDPVDSHAARSVVASNDHPLSSHSAIIQSQVDNIASNYPQSVTSAKDMGAALLPANTPSSQASSSNGLLATTEAVFQLAASDVVNPSIHPVVLSDGDQPFSSALQQAMLQVGFETGTSRIHFQNTIDVSNLDSGTPAAPLTSSTSPGSSTSSTASGQIASISQVMKTVEAFLENNPSYEIAVSGTNVMIVDTKIADAASLNFGVLTFDLASGSTVSVVGILPHPHHPAAAAA